MRKEAELVMSERKEVSRTALKGIEFHPIHCSFCREDELGMQHWKNVLASGKPLTRTKKSREVKKKETPIGTRSCNYTGI